MHLNVTTVSSTDLGCCCTLGRREAIGALSLLMYYVSDNCPDSARSISCLCNPQYISFFFQEGLEKPANAKCQALLITRITHALVK